MAPPEKIWLDGADLKESLDFRHLLRPGSPIEAACRYEYMRESRTLRNAISAKDHTVGQVPYAATQRLSFADSVRLVIALGRAGFPKPWSRLAKSSQECLASLIADWKLRQVRVHAPVLVEEAHIELDYEGDTADQPYHWRLEPVEPGLLRKYERSGRKYFFGFIRIDEAYNETDVCEAFKRWFAKRYKRRRKGNPHYYGKLRQLAAMRIRHYYPRREREKMLVQITGKKTYQRKPYKQDFDTDSTDTGLSRDCRAAQEFFRSLFPGEKPIHFPPKC